MPKKITTRTPSRANAGLALKSPLAYMATPAYMAPTKTANAATTASAAKMTSARNSVGGRLQIAAQDGLSKSCLMADLPGLEAYARGKEPARLVAQGGV